MQSSSSPQHVMCRAAWRRPSIRRAAVDWTGDWHTFAIDWSPHALVWLIDGVERARRVAGTPASLFVPSDPFYMILNTALNPWADASLDSGLPVEHLVDYVRWCQRDGVE